MKRLRVIAILILIFGLPACVPALTKPDLVLQEIELTGVSFSSIDFTFQVAVKNPNSVGVTIESLSYQLDLDNVPLGSGNIGSPVHIKASASEIVPLPFTTHFSGMSHLLKVILGESDVNYHLKGAIVVSKFWVRESFPFEANGSVPINRSSFHH